MAVWSRNHRACATTWTTLLLLDQVHEVFRDSGTIPMKQLTFAHSAASDEMRALQTTTLATQMDNVFTQVRGATHETGVDKAAAIAALRQGLLDGDATIADLAEVADKHYRFFGEQDATG